MKKTLVALAALAATSAFAQSTVVLDGNLDISYASVGASGQDTATTRKGSTVTALAGSSTSTINITATDDMGGGMKGLARFEIDPRGFLVDGAALGAHQRFVGVSGGFGTVKIGAVDSAAVAWVNAYGSALGTATGSGYGNIHSRLIADTRYNRSAKYETPVISGFQASVLYAPGVDRADATAGTAYAGLPFQRRVTEIGASYQNGPLNVAFANLKGAATDATSTVTPVGTKSSSTNMLSANYTVGAATVYVGMNNGQTLGTTESNAGVYTLPAVAAGIDTNGSRVGLKYVMGTTNFIVSQAQQTIKNATEEKRKVTGFRATQELSKQSSVYLAYEKYDTGIATVGTAAGTYTVTAVGLRRQF
jgi:predicted porin